MSARAVTRVIAHRGASGYLPEHTLAAKTLAYGLGADFLEQDLVATRDRELVVLHDIHLNDVSDVAEIYPGRARSDGYHYVLDFDLAELRQLRLVERRAPGGVGLRFRGRFGFPLDGFRVVTLDEELTLLAELNRSTGRRVGVYPEIKEPGWHHEHGIDVSGLLLDRLARFGYGSRRQEVYVQCFDAAELERLHGELGCELPLIQLLDAGAAQALAADADAAALVAERAAGVGIPYRALLGRDDSGPVLSPGPLIALLDRAGLVAHPYTLRRDQPAAPAASFEELLDFFIHELRVDALFCDHPDWAVRCRDRPRP